MTPPSMSYEEIARQRQSRVLFLSANPEGTIISYEKELTAIRAEVQRSRIGADFDFDVWLTVTTLEMGRQVARCTSDIVHFCAPGGQGMVALGGPEERPSLVTAEELGGLFAAVGMDLMDDERLVRLVVLNACQSRAAADAIASHVACVIGVEGDIPDSTARAFAASFYGRLANGKSVRAAYNIALSLTRAQRCADTERFRLVEKVANIADTIRFATSP